MRNGAPGYRDTMQTHTEHANLKARTRDDHCPAADSRRDSKAPGSCAHSGLGVARTGPGAPKAAPSASGVAVMVRRVEGRSALLNTETVVAMEPRAVTTRPAFNSEVLRAAGGASGPGGVPAGMAAH